MKFGSSNKRSTILTVEELSQATIYTISSEKECFRFYRSFGTDACHLALFVPDSLISSSGTHPCRFGDPFVESPSSHRISNAVIGIRLNAQKLRCYLLITIKDNI